MTAMTIYTVEAPTEPYESFEIIDTDSAEAWSKAGFTVYARTE